MIEVFKGSTSRSTFYVLRDAAGIPKTGLAFGDVTASYVRAGATRVAITTVTQTATGAFSAGGFVEIDATNTPGLYRFDVPDAAFASGAEEVAVALKGVSFVAETKGFVLVNWNKQVTSIPNVAAGASGGLPTGDSSGKVTLAAVTHTGAILPRVTLVDNTTQINGTAPEVGSGAIDANITAVNGTTVTGANVPTDIQTIKGQAVTAASGVTFPASIGTSTFSGGAVASVTGAVGSVTGAVASVTGNVGGNVVGSVGSLTGYTAPPTVVQIRQEMDSNSTKLANLDAAVSSRSTFAGGAVASVTAPVQIDMTQAVPISNTTETVGDALNAARAQAFGSWSISGTTLVLKSANGTPVHTFTLNDPSNPTVRS